MNGKNIFGQINIRASMTQPKTKKLSVVRLLVPITSPRFMLLTKSKLAKNSALPNTAGITVEKLNVVQNANSSREKSSVPIYVQFWVRMLSNSKIHQTGAEIRNNPKYLRGLRLNNDVPVRQWTRPSMV